MTASAVAFLKTVEVAVTPWCRDAPLQPTVWATATAPAHEAPSTRPPRQEICRFYTSALNCMTDGRRGSAPHSRFRALVSKKQEAGTGSVRAEISKFHPRLCKSKNYCNRV